MSKYLPITLRTAAMLIALAVSTARERLRVYGITMAQPYT